MNCHVFLAENVLAIQAPYYMKDVCKSIPGARWKPELKMWTYPATPSAARQIFLTLPHAESSWADEAKILLVEAHRMDAAQAHKTAEDLPLPAITLKKPAPWKHQVRGYHFAKDLPASMLAMEMRTGKTRVTIDILVNRGARLVLVICPAKVLEGEVWSEQFRQYCLVPHYVMELRDGSVADRAKQLARQEELSRCRGEMLVVCLNFQAMWRYPMDNMLLAMKWDSVVLDESHRIKSPGGKASMFASRLGDRVPHRMCLTGTPMAHSPLDVYGQYRFLDKGIYGTSFTAFRARYAKMGGFGGKQVTGYQNTDDLHAKFYSIAYRVLTEDVLDLPPKQDIVKYCQLSPYAKKVYQELEKDFVAEVGDGTVTASNAMTRLLRLQQLTSGYLRQDRDIETGEEGAVVRVDHSKQELLHELLEDINPDEPVVVYCRFHHDLDAVHEVASVLGRSSSECSGRRNELKDWQRGKTIILAVQIQSGSEGNDFVRAHYMFFYSIGYSLNDFKQAYMRIRSGAQKDTCSYFYLIAKGTKDEAVYTALEARQDVVESVLKGVKE